MKNLDRAIDECMFWFMIIAMNLCIFALLGMMAWSSWNSPTPFFIVFPILMLVVLRNTLYRSWVAIFTLNKDLLPRASFFF